MKRESLDENLAVQSPWAVGLLRLPGGFQTYSVSLRDIERDTAWARHVFEWIGLACGKPVLLIGAGADSATLWPYENALIGMKVPFGCAEPVQIDAPRSDMFLRRFALQAVVGLSADVVAGILALGRDLPALLGRSTLVALPDACERLRACGLAPWRMVAIGPIYAIEPPQGGGARYDTSEWLVEEEAGELLITARAARASAFVRLKTGVRGRVETRDTGEDDPRLVVAA